MKKILLFMSMTIVSFIASAQFVARMEMKEDVAGICDKNNVYAIFPVKGQKEAVCPISIEDIFKRLNNEVAFLKENPSYKDKGMINLLINCKGEVVKCEMDNKTQSTILDKQIEEVFNSLGIWKAAKLNGKEVDSSKLFSFVIKNGKISED